MEQNNLLLNKTVLTLPMHTIGIMFTVLKQMFLWTWIKTDWLVFSCFYTNVLWIDDKCILCTGSICPQNENE